jgi:hypothetical protein
MIRCIYLLTPLSDITWLLRMCMLQQRASVPSFSPWRNDVINWSPGTHRDARPSRQPRIKTNLYPVFTINAFRFMALRVTKFDGDAVPSNGRLIIVLLCLVDETRTIFFFLFCSRHGLRKYVGCRIDENTYGWPWVTSRLVTWVIISRGRITNNAFENYMPLTHNMLMLLPS